MNIGLTVREGVLYVANGLAISEAAKTSAI